MRPVPVAVIGCGHLGTFHARLYRSMPEADLRLVVDRNREKAKLLGESLGVPFSCAIEDAFPAVEAVSVATPTSTHREVAGALLAAGKNVLVEKPLAAGAAEGEELVALARDRGLLLAVGHIERFNPAIVAARESIRHPRFVESHRLSTFVPRSIDVDVVLDLMIHDLDLVLALVEEEVASCDAVGVPVLTPGADIANARLRFVGGAVANLTASRVSRERVRKIRFFARHRYVSLDLMTGKAEQVVLRRIDSCDGPDTSDPALAAYLAAHHLRLDHGSIAVPPGNALEEELRDFLRALDGSPLQGATGEAGLRSLSLALAVQEKVHASRGDLVMGSET